MNEFIKKTTAVVLTVLMLFSSAPFTEIAAIAAKAAETVAEIDDQSNQQNSTDEIFTVSENEDGTIKIISYNADEDIVEIPSVISEKTVTVIGEEAFKNKKLLAVNIPNTVTTIENRAFEGCKNLLELVIPDSVTTIKTYAFQSCISLRSVVIGKNVTTISSSFSNCYSLAKVYNLSSLTLEKGKSTNGYVSLYALDIKTSTDGKEDDFVEYGDFTFTSSENKYYLIKYNGDQSKVELPEKININGTEIKSYSIFNAAFYNKYTMSEVVIPNSVVEIGKYAFFECDGLKSVTIPKSVTKIDQYAFYWCKNLRKIIIGEGVTTIDSSAFTKCTKLWEVYNLSTLDIQKDSSENGCIGLYAIQIYSSLDEEPIKLVNKNDFIFARESDVDYLVSYDGNEAEIILPDSYEYDGNTINQYKIRKYAFYGFELLTDVVVPDSVTQIGSYAFYDCKNILSISIENNVTEIGSYAFYGCKNMQSLSLGNGVTDIGSYAFYSCSSLADIDLSGKVKTIGSYAFSNCHSLKSVDICDNVKSVRKNAFSGCKELKSVNIGAGLSKINESVFSGCSKLESVNIGENVKTIETYAFSDCESLKSINIYYGVSLINYSAFSRCNMLADVYIYNPECQINYYTGFIAAVYGRTFPKNTVFHGYANSGAYDYAIDNNNQFVEIKCDHSQPFERNADANCTLPSRVEHVCSECKNVISYDDTGEHVALGHSFTLYKSDNNATETDEGTITATCDRCDETKTLVDHKYRVMYKQGENGETYLHCDTCENEISLGSGPYYYKFYANCDDDVNSKLEWEFYGLNNKGQKVKIDEISEFYFETVGLYTISEGTSECFPIYCTLKYNFGWLRSLGADFYMQIGKDRENSVPVKLEITTDQTRVKINESYVKISSVGNSKGTISFTALHEHRMDSTATILPTCTADGYTETSCTLCNRVERTDHVDALGHDYNSGEHFDATADTDGYTRYTCKNCGDSYDVIDPARIVDNFAAIPGTHCIDLSWSKAIEASVTGYKLYRKSQNEEDFSLLATIDSRDTVHYTDANLDADIEYSYKISASKGELEGKVSEAVTAKPLIDTQAPIMKSFTPDNGTALSKTVQFVGTASDNIAVTGFELYISNDGTNFESLAKVNGTSFNYSFDSTKYSDGQYVFKLVAIDAEDNKSQGLVRTFIIDNTGPQQVKNVRAIETFASKITLAWDKDENQETFSYVLGKKDGDTYKIIQRNITVCGCYLSGLEPETEYTYVVAGVDAYGNTGAWSESITVKTLKDVTAPSIIEQLPSSKAINQGIEFSVTAEDDVAIAEMQLRVYKDGKWQSVKESQFSGKNRREKLSGYVDLSEFSEGIVKLSGAATDTSGNSTSDENAVFSEYYIDRTAPKAPKELTAEGKDGAILLSWSENEETDKKNYYIYRSQSADGEYAFIASVKALGYVDNTTQTDTTYYYKICVDDSAGNTSEFSNVVSAKRLSDTIAPSVTKITLSADRETVTVQAKDNRAVESIQIEYRYDSREWITLNNTDFTKAGIYAVATAKLPYSDFEDSKSVSIRAKAVDSSGYDSDFSEELSFVVDKTGVQICNAKITVNKSRVNITWDDAGEADVNRFIVRASKSNGTEFSLATVKYAGKHSYTVTSDVSSYGAGTYYFFIDSYDNTGNANTAALEAVRISSSEIGELPETEKKINAVFTAPKYMEQSVQELFDASASSNYDSKMTYSWDFGDSTTAEGVKVTKSFAKAGEYTVKLTVSDSKGNYGTYEKQIIVSKREKLGTVNVHVIDEKGNSVNGAIVNFSPDNGDTVSYTTNSGGKLSFKALEGKGSIISLRQNGSNYDWSAARTVSIVGGKEIDIEIVLYSQLYTTSLTVRKMELSEILAAGIDVTDPANNNYYTGVIQFRYGGKIYTGEYIRDDNTILKVEWPDLPSIDSEVHSGKMTAPEVTYIPNEQGAELLGIVNVPFNVGYLKDFYCVQFTLLNNGTSDYTLVNNEVTLSHDAGLCLISDASGYESENIASLPSIPGGGSASAAWCLRGDNPGTHKVSVSGSGYVDVLGKQYPAIYNTEPVSIEVKKMSEVMEFVVETPDDLFMQLRDDDEITLKYNDLSRTVSLGDYEANMYFNVGIKNISDEDMYIPKISITEKDIGATLKSNGVTVKGDVVAKQTALFMIGTDGKRTELSSELYMLPPGCTFVKYYKVKFLNADGLSYKTVYSQLSSIALAQVSDPDVKVETNVDDSLFSLYYYGKLFSKHIHSFKLIIGEIGGSATYRCPCGYTYSGEFTDDIGFISDSKGQAVLDDLGFDLTKVLQNISFEDGKIVGPEIEVLNKRFNLFELKTSLKLPILNDSSITVDMEKQVIKILIGQEQKESANIGQAGQSSNYWEESYKEVKNFYKSIQGKDASTQKLYNDFRKVRQKMRHSKALKDQKIGLNFDASVLGYIELSFKNDKISFIGGGIVAGFEIAGTHTCRLAVFPAAYFEFGLSANLGGKFNVEYLNEKFDVSGEISAGLGASLTIGLGDNSLLKTYIQGKGKGSIGVTYTFPATTFEEAMKLKLDASINISAAILGYEICDIPFGPWSKQLFPPENKTEKARLARRRSSQSYDAVPVERDYTMTETADITEYSFVKSDLYPYSSPSIVTLDDGKQLMLWIDDNGKKSLINRTGLFYSVYSEGIWSEPAELETTGFVGNVKAISNDGKAYVIFEAASESLSEDADVFNLAESMELYMTIYDNGVFTAAKRLTNNDVYEIGYDFGISGSQITVSYIENSENDFLMNSGITSIKAFTVDSDNNFETVNVDSGKEVKAFDVSSDGGEIYYVLSDNENVLNCYSGGEKHQTYTAQESISSVNAFEDSAVFVADGYVIEISNGKAEKTGLAVTNGLTAIEQNGVRALMTCGMNGDVYSAVYDSKASEYSAFETVFRCQDSFIREYAATVDLEGNICCAVNGVVTEDDGSQTATLYVKNSSQCSDISIDNALTVEDDYKTVAFDVTNNFTNAVKCVNVVIKDGENVIFDSDIRTPIASGETVTLYVPIEDYNLIGKKLSITVKTAYEEMNDSDNTATLDVGKSDIELSNVTFERKDSKYIINATVKNIGDVAAKNVSVSLDRIAYGCVENIEVGTVNVNEEKTVSFFVPKELWFAEEKAEIELSLSSFTDTDEKSYLNNDKEIAPYNRFFQLLDKCDHEYSLVKNEDSTCAKCGYELYECTLCLETKRIDLDIDSKVHAKTKLVNAKTATCSETGYTGDTVCVDCEAVVSKGKSINKKPHNYTSVIISPTCTESGYTEYMCLCGDNYRGNYTEPTGHDYQNGVCKNCGAHDDMTKNCDCMCHSTNGFVKLIWKIVCAIYKLFKTKQVCDCGAMHY